MSNTNNNMQPQTSSVLQNDTASLCSTSKVQEKTQLSRTKCMNSLRAIQSQLKFLIETLQDFGNMPIFKRTFSQDLDLLENHLTKEISSQTDCKTTLTKLRTTFENAFSSEIKARMQNYTRYDAQSFYDAMIFNMDSLGKYMLELILHQQRTPQLLKQKKLMQTQEDHSNPIPALNVDSLKVDLVVIQNTCSEKEDSNSETASSKLVLDLEKEKDAQAVESSDDDLDEEDTSKQGRKNDKTNPMLHESNFDGFDDETVDAATTGVSTASAQVTTAGVAISIAEPRTPPTTTTVFDDEDVTMAMAQTLIKMKEEKAKEKGVAFKDVEDSSRPVRSITTLQSLPSIDPKDKGKGIIDEGEPVKVKRKDQGLAQIESDAELAHILHEEELAKIERIQKEKATQEEVSMHATYEEYDTIQASIDADALFAAKLQQEDREQYTIE
ncbi:hypothetical protein Tco_0222516 [Tanacetum coccineum]